MYKSHFEDERKYPDCVNCQLLTINIQIFETLIIIVGERALVHAASDMRDCGDSLPHGRPPGRGEKDDK